MGTARTLEETIDQVERASGLDAWAARVQGWLRKSIPPGPVEDTLHGEQLGHPLHPALVQVPLGAWLSSLIADVLGEPSAARKLTAIGCVTALPAALAGAADWMTTDGAVRRVGFVHAAVNDAALVAFTMSWQARRRGRRGRGLLHALVGTGLVSAGGWLGGHLAYAQGTGVDTADFLRRQGRAAKHQVDGTPVGEPSHA